MATLMNNSSGNFTTAATWGVVDSTSYLNSETNTTNTTTSFVSSQSFIYLLAPTVEGIAVKVSARSASPTGTFSVRLHDGTAAVAGTTVTIDVADIPAVNGSTLNGWLFMKFSAPVALALLTNYTVQVQSSSNAQVTLFRNATAGNWSRALRTTTTQAPAAADELLICGEYLSAGSNNTLTVTMDNTTAATTFGAIQVTSKGILDWGISASTNYYLKIAGNLSIYTAGTYQQGTGSSPMPISSTGKLEFDNASNVQFGIEVRLGGTFKSGGTVITNSALLAADAAASATSLTTNISTGWLNGDVIGIASTTRLRAECEKKALTADASGTSLTITALTNAHSGTSPIQAELINLTRNVQIFGTSTTLQAYLNISTSSIVDIQSTEFFNMGSATSAKRGIDIGTTTGSCTINNCSMHDFTVTGSIATVWNAAANNNITYSNNVIFGTASNGLNCVSGTATNNSISNVIVMLTGQAAAAIGCSLGNLFGTINGITSIGASSTGIRLGQIATTGVMGTITNLIAHSGAGSGIDIVNFTNFGNNPLANISNLTTWRNSVSGLVFNNAFGAIIDTLTSFGNTTAGIQYVGSTGNMFIKNAVVNAGVTLTQPVGVGITSDIKECYIDSSTFGVSETHSTADVNVTSTNIYPRIVFRNCLFNSTTPFANQDDMIEFGSIHSARHQQTAGNHRTMKKFGTVTIDTTIFNQSSPSTRLTPTNASNKLFSGFKKVAVPNGQTAIVRVYVRKSVVGDGAAYNGNQPRLMLRADPSIGVNADTVLATATNAANGAFELLQATLPAITDNGVFQMYIDCDGTIGWVNCDDWSVIS